MTKTTPEVQVLPAPVAEAPEVTQRKAVLSKNPDELTFAYAPFYNLANIRTAAKSLIVRASSDPAKVDAIRETLEVLLEFLNLRAEHGANVRAASIAAEKAADVARTKAAAEAREADAKALLKDGKATVTRAERILKALRKGV